MTKILVQKSGVLVLASLISLSLFGCTNGPCRRQEAGFKKMEDGGLIKTTKEEQLKVSLAGKTYVYKYDGSRQCQTQQGETLENMSKELAGIKIFSQAKHSDGKMHMSVCGGNTGIANVYLIPESDLKKAIDRGFLKWRN